MPTRRQLITALLAAVPLLATAATPLDLAYNPANTGPAYAWLLDGVRVSADGQRIQVRTQPFGNAVGGTINLGSYPWWITLAAWDHGVGRTGNGDRWRGNAALPATTGRWSTVAVLVPGSNAVYRVKPIATGGIVRGLPGVTWSGTVQGTLTTDGTRGPISGTHLLDFDLHIIGQQQ
jgi:hypothetical protein